MAKPVEPGRNDALIERVRDAVAKMEAHEHRGGLGESDHYCLNLACWVGEKGKYILAHIEALEAELAELRKAAPQRRADSNELHVTVRGSAGKVTIARLLKTALLQAGVRVILTEGADDAPIQERLTVHIETR